MDFMSYPSMDNALPFEHQNQQVFDFADDETFEMEHLLAAAFHSSSSSDLIQCFPNDDHDIPFDPLCSDFFLHDQNDDAFLPHHFFVDHKDDVFLAAAADDEAIFPQNLFISPLDHCYQLGNELNHSDTSLKKRPKMSPNDSSNFLQGLLAPPQLVVTAPPPPLQFSIPPVFSHGISTNNNSTDEEEKRSLSTQSLSARQRRRKISEKTKELGKLVPGGQKMNTAEMFEAASSYINFLQAQFAVLQIMESSSLTPTDDEEALQCLVESPLIQEKLYSSKKCLIPKGLVESLENHNQIQSNTQIKKDVRNLIRTFC